MVEELPTAFAADSLVFNGIRGDTGDYGLPPMPTERLARLLAGSITDEDRRELLDREMPSEAVSRRLMHVEKEKERIRLQELDSRVGSTRRLSAYSVKEAGLLRAFPVKEGVEPRELKEAGWALILPAKMEEKRRREIKKALTPLLDLRRGQTNDLFRVFEGGDGYRPGERTDQFFKRQKPEIMDGPADPEQLPFYVLLVGSPEEIPYSFQFDLDGMRGVGRIDFGDDFQAYNSYARNVVLAEGKKRALPQQVSFWGTCFPEDRHTELSSRFLVQELYKNLQVPKPPREIGLKHRWELKAFIDKGQATKEQLWRLLGGDPAQAPALLFTSSHGLEWPLNHDSQLPHQGALLCQDWPGPRQAVKRDHYFAGEDLSRDASILGMIAVIYACYGAGTPKYDHFARQAFRSRMPVAPYAFTGRLPQAMLRQGAVAVIGHVERTWGYSFLSASGQLDNQAFITALRMLLTGDPVGLATDPSFNLRYAAKAARLNNILENEEHEPGSVNVYELAELWTSTNDARNYVVVGDPAARLPVADVPPAEPERPVALIFREQQLRREAVQRHLRQMLQQDRGEILAALGRFFARSIFDDARRDAAWEDRWRAGLAEVLATELFDEIYVEPDQINRLHDRLRGHTLEKIGDIVVYIAEERPEELADLLLRDQDEESDDALPPHFKELLRRDVESKLRDAHYYLRNDEIAAALQGDTAAQSDWLEMLIRSLQVVPIAACEALGDLKTRARERLVEVVDSLAQSCAVPSPWLEALRQDLNALPKSAAWPELLETLRRGLEARIDAQDDTVPWLDIRSALDTWITRLLFPLASRAVIAGFDPTDLSQSGWGIIFPYEDPQRPKNVLGIKAALQPLLELRQAQARDCFRVFYGGSGYRPYDTAARFLARQYVRIHDPADPQKVPYYLLIVGSPEEIPFRFQYELDAAYAVGRLDFGDDLEAYANYARSVVVAETEASTLPRTISFFAPMNPGDEATEKSAYQLVGPLHRHIGRQYGSEWQVNAVLQSDATKARLMRLLGGEETPAFLFAACHGLQCERDDPERQLRFQGSLLCQEWPGPLSAAGLVSRDQFLAGQELGEDANLRGMIAFFFACYSAGTPRFDEYPGQDSENRAGSVAPRAFIAALPKAMLSRPKGGALAVVGHVERAWETSVKGPEQVAVFSSAVERLLRGEPVGHAMSHFDQRHVALAVRWARTKEVFEMGLPIPPDQLEEMWIAGRDARGYILIGDPAVRLPRTRR